MTCGTGSGGPTRRWSRPTLAVAGLGLVAFFVARARRLIVWVVEQAGVFEGVVLSRDALGRVERDVQATTPLVLEMKRSPQDGIEVYVDARRVMSAGVDMWLSAASVAELVQDQVVIEALGAAWPRCLRHGRHPMRAVEEEDDGWWACPADGERLARIGELVPSSVEEPTVADDMVRWFRDDLGWGVIAHSAGDVWVHFSAIVADGHRALAEGDHVEWVAEPGASQGAFGRRARAVRRLDGVAL